MLTESDARALLVGKWGQPQPAGLALRWVRADGARILATPPFDPADGYSIQIDAPLVAP